MNDSVRHFFRLLNRFFMVPLFRLGFGSIFGNPISGYIMVIKTLGRKSGKVRFAPVNYAIWQGSVYCLAGFGRISDWYRNLSANPQVDLILPGGSFQGVCETVTDPDVQRILLRQILKNGGFAGFFEGFNPFKISDEELMRKIGDLPLVRIRPQGLGSGPSDPGGLAWVTTLLASLALVALLIAILSR